MSTTSEDKKKMHKRSDSVTIEDIKEPKEEIDEFKVKTERRNSETFEPDKKRNTAYREHKELVSKIYAME